MWYQDMAAVFRGYNMLEKGVLPHSGGWAEQPYKLMHYIDIVRAEINRRDGNG